MNKTPSRPWIVVAFAVCVCVGLPVFLFGCGFGYCRGAFGDGGSVEQGLDWGIKTGLLLCAMSAIVGVLGGLILPKLNLPHYVVWGLIIGLAFAIMNGGGVLLGMNSNELVPETIKGLLGGAFIGALSGPFIQRNQSRRIKSLQSKNDIEPR